MVRTIYFTSEYADRAIPVYVTSSQDADEAVCEVSNPNADIIAYKTSHYKAQLKVYLSKRS